MCLHTVGPRRQIKGRTTRHLREATEECEEPRSDRSVTTFNLFATQNMTQIWRGASNPKGSAVLSNKYVFSKYTLLRRNTICFEARTYHYLYVLRSKVFVNDENTRAVAKPRETAHGETAYHVRTLPKSIMMNQRPEKERFRKARHDERFNCVVSVRPKVSPAIFRGVSSGAFRNVLKIYRLRYRAQKKN